MHKPALLVLALGFMLAPAAAFAQANTPGVDARQTRQDGRIDQGIAAGRINPNEARRLERGQARINRAEDRARADGTVTRRERARLHRGLNAESRGIYRARHNRR